MTMDRTLKISGSLLRARSVLSRDERIAHLTDEGKFDPEKDSPYGLPKVKVRHSKAGHKTKKSAKETQEQTHAEGEDAEAEGQGT